MAVSAAQLLDELMGRDRNRAPGEPSSKHHWSDPEVCKSFLCGFCPHELFTNTKADLGTCPKVHDEPLKKEYENSNRRGHMGYEENFMRFLQGTMADVERRIRRGHERLALNAKKEKELTNIKGDDEKISMISDHINQLLEEIESLGTQGKVEEAQGVMKLVDQLKEEKETLSQMSKLNPLSSQEKQMEVCEICGAFLIVGDAQSRVDDHLQGKQHVGYARIKNTLEEMQAGTWKLNQQDSKEESEKNVSIKSEDATEREGRREKSRECSKETSRRRDRGDRDRVDREKRGDRDRDRSRERNRDRDRDRDRDRRERERSRERRRDRGKRRSRSRERRSRSRDRYRKRGSRDRDRRRSRSHDRSRRRSRSRDRDRKRSRSGERDRRRSRERKSGRSRSRSGGHRRSRSRSQSQNHKVRSSRDSADSDQSSSKKDQNSCKEAEPVNSVAVSSTREGSEIKEEQKDVASLNNTADQDM